MNYYLFLDESGDHGLKNIDINFPVFVLCGIIISETEYNNLIRVFNDLKKRFWGVHKVILHSRDIRKCNNEFQILFDPEIKKSFIEELNKVIIHTDFKVIASVIDKKSFVKKYGKLKDDVYEVSLSFIIERSVFFLDSLNDPKAKLSLIIEQRGKKEDAKLKSHFNRLFQLGTYFVKASRIKKYNMSIDFRAKSQDISGLQLADLVAYPIARYAMDKSRFNPSYNIVEPKIYTQGTKKYGLKFFP